jgi:hypothetical protein
VAFTRSDESAIGKVEGIGDELLFDRFMNREIAETIASPSARPFEFQFILTYRCHSNRGIPTITTLLSNSSDTLELRMRYSN